MAVKKFYAVDMRAAPGCMREQLGEDASSLSTRRLEDGVEVVAAVEISLSGPAPDSGFLHGSCDPATMIACQTDSELESDVSLTSNALGSICDCSVLLAGSARASFGMGRVQA